MNLRNAIRQSKPIFLWKRRKELKAGNLPLPEDLPADQIDPLQALRRDGVWVKPSFFSREQTDAMARELRPLCEQLAKGEYKGRDKTFVEDGQYRLLNADRLSVAAQSFFYHPYFEKVGSLYAGTTLKPYLHMVELRNIIGLAAKTDFFHFDDWRYRFKAFLYLTDVGPENAPFTYLVGSHLNRSWRTEKEFEYYRLGKRGSYGIYQPAEAEVLKKDFGFEERVCTGPAGTLILTDTRGVHRGTTLNRDSRLLLATYFEIPK